MNESQFIPNPLLRHDFFPFFPSIFRQHEQEPQMLLLQEAGSPFTNRNEASQAKSNQFDTFHPNISIYILHTVLYYIS